MYKWSRTTEKDQNELILLNLIQQNLMEPKFDKTEDSKQNMLQWTLLVRK